MGNLAPARIFWDFRQLKVPQNPLEPAKCVFWKEICHHRFEFFTFEASKTILNVIFIKKSCGSENFFDFGQLKMLFKVTFNVKHLRMFWHQLFHNKWLFWLGNIALARNFWDFRQLKVPQNPLEPAKCIFWNRNCHHRFDFLPLNVHLKLVKPLYVIFNHGSR